jgi:putative flippase GtrA
MTPFLKRTSRYTQVGLLCAVLNNLIVIAMDHAGYQYVVAVCTAFIAVTLIGYLLHSTYTFGVRASRAGGLRFIVASLTAFPLSLGAMFVMCGGMGLSASVAMPIATVLLFAWNYALAHLAVFRPERQRG